MVSTRKCADGCGQPDSPLLSPALKPPPYPSPAHDPLVLWMLVRGDPLSSARWPFPFHPFSCVQVYLAAVLLDPHPTHMAPSWL